MFGGKAFAYCCPEKLVTLNSGRYYFLSYVSIAKLVCHSIEESTSKYVDYSISASCFLGMKEHTIQFHV